MKKTTILLVLALSFAPMPQLKAGGGDPEVLEFALVCLAAPYVLIGLAAATGVVIGTNILTGFAMYNVGKYRGKNNSEMQAENTKLKDATLTWRKEDKIDDLDLYQAKIFDIIKIRAISQGIYSEEKKTWEFS